MLQYSSPLTPPDDRNTDDYLQPRLLWVSEARAPASWAQPLLWLPEPWRGLMEAAVATGYQEHLEHPSHSHVPRLLGELKAPGRGVLRAWLRGQPLPTCENWRPWLRGSAGSRRKWMELQALGRALGLHLKSTCASATEVNGLREWPPLSVTRESPSTAM